MCPFEPKLDPSPHMPFWTGIGSFSSICLGIGHVTRGYRGKMYCTPLPFERGPPHVSTDSHFSTRWSTLLSSQVNLLHEIFFMALCGAHSVTLRSKKMDQKILGLHRAVTLAGDRGGPSFVLGQNYHHPSRLGLEIHTTRFMYAC